MDLLANIIGDENKYNQIVELRNSINSLLSNRKPVYDLINPQLLDRELELCLSIQEKSDKVLSFLDKVEFVNECKLKSKNDELKSKRLQYTLDFDHNHQDLKKTLKVDDFKNEKELIVSNLVRDVQNEYDNLLMNKDFLDYEKDKYKRIKDFIHDVYDALKKKYHLYSQIC